MKIISQVMACKDLRKSVPSTRSGKGIIPIYKMKFEKDGTETLEMIGEHDLYADIQSHADSVDIHVIIGQCMRRGDYSALYQREGFYEDLTQMPKTYAEALQMVADGENLWNQMPADIKEKFDNSVAKFIASAFTPEWTEKLQIKKDKPVTEAIKEEGVVKNE